MAFGWSAGDILAAINFILDVASALDDVSGSGSSFRSTKAFLEDLSEHALAPLLTCSALDAYPDQKAIITKHVDAIKTPVKEFIDSVEGLEKDLGVPHKGRLKHFRGWRGKFRWYFFTKEKAEALQKEIEPHMRIIDSLMQKLSLTHVHNFREDMPKIVSKAVTDAWDVRQATSEAALKELLEEILEKNFERYLGSQQLKLIKEDEELPPRYVAEGSSYSAEKLQSCVSHLKSRCQLNILDDISEEIGGIDVHPDIAIALGRWWIKKSSAFLWIQGPPNADIESSMSTQMVAMARTAKIPVLAYFCERFDADGTLTTQIEVLCNLIYSLIYQLVHNILSDFSSIVNLPPERFAGLDGKRTSLIPALSLFEDLLLLAPSPLIIVLYGLDLLDFSEDGLLDVQIDRFFDILMLGPTIQFPEKVIKTLFYTSEQSRILMDRVEPENNIDATLTSGSDGYFAFPEFE